MRNMDTILINVSKKAHKRLIDLKYEMQLRNMGQVVEILLKKMKGGKKR